MKKMNRMWQAATALVMAACICGCGGPAAEPGESTGSGTADVEGLPVNQATGEDSQKVSQADSTETNEAGGFYFNAGGVVVKADMDMDELAPSLGESKSIFEAPSCAGEGISYTYNFSSYEIETYPAADGKNRIGYIVLKDDTVATAEGIDMSMTREDVIRTYGEDYDEAENGIIYEKDGTKLSFIFDGDNIISIQYASAVIG